MRPRLLYLDRFVSAATQFGDRPAVAEGESITTYGQLHALARRLAYALADAARGPKVLIHLPQVAAAYASMFAAGLAGSFYATTNVAAPLERRRGTFEAFDPDVVVTSDEYAAEALAVCPNAFVIDVDALGDAELPAPLEPHDLAYVMFTSGSTGRPKGVMISKAALSHYVDWISAAMNVGPDDRWSQHPNIAFDLSVLDIYGALCFGAVLVPIAGDDLIMPANAIRQHRLTIWNSVPSVMTSMLRMRQVTKRNFESLRMLTFCGEPLQKLHLDAIFDARPDVIVHNTYGPTEATVSCTLLRLTANNYAEACQPTVAIGNAISDMAIDLVGADPEEGEIAISGPQLAVGYWNDPEMSSRQFRLHEVGGVAKRAYFTGDWAQRIGNNVYFRSRIDTQVKIRGERIELDEIASVLMKCGSGFACALLIGETLHGVFEQEVPLTKPQVLAAKIREYLPMHLVPKHFHVFGNLPRNPNGKVDLAAVRKLVEERSAAQGHGHGDDFGRLGPPSAHD